jgi:hypothetical protein
MRKLNKLVRGTRSLRAQVGAGSVDSGAGSLLGRVGGRLRGGLSRVRSMIEAAGSASPAGPSTALAEQLEARQYLFTLTVDPGDATFAGTPQFGTVVAFFAYAIPQTLVTDALETDPLTPRIFGAAITLSGPVGSSIEVLDLYGRQMIRTIAVLADPDAPDGVDRLLIDRNQDFIPDFNDGIGRITILQGDATTRLHITGGRIIELTDGGGGNDSTPPFPAGPGIGDEGAPVVRAIEPNTGWAERNVDGSRRFFPAVAGEDTTSAFVYADEFDFYSEFEAAGFGFGVDQSGNAIGLPGGPGSVIIGSPFTRDPRRVDLYYGTGIQNRPSAIPANPNNGNFGLGPPDGQVIPAFNFSGVLLEDQFFITGPANARLLGQGQGATPAEPPVPANGPFPLPPVPPATEPPPLPPPPDFALVNVPSSLVRVGIVTGPGVTAIGSVVVNGMMFGTSTFAASVGEFAVGYLPGSVRIDGDVGDFYVGGIAGFWTRDDAIGDAGTPDAPNATGSQITVRGTARQIKIAGRSLATITVLGDSVTGLTRLAYGNYQEREAVRSINRDATELDPEFEWNQSASLFLLNDANWTRPLPLLWGSGEYRNDDFTNAEFVGSVLRSVQISGAVGRSDLINDEDRRDYYSFAAEGGQTVSLTATWTRQGQNPGQMYIRVFDSNRNLVAAIASRGTLRENGTPGDLGGRASFVAPGTGVYYVEVATAIDETFNTAQAYSMTITGMASVTVGQFFTGGGAQGGSFRLANGSMGQVSRGSGIVRNDNLGGGGQTVLTSAQVDGIDPNGNSAQDYFETTAESLQIAGSLFDYTSRGNLVGGLLSVSGSVGDISVGGEFSEGTLMGTTFLIGGTLGTLDVAAGQNFQNIATLRRQQTGNVGQAVTLTTGAGGVPGHVGRIEIGGVSVGGRFTLNTSAGSFVDVWTVGVEIADSEPNINMGQGSDIRFASFPRSVLVLPGQPQVQQGIPLIYNQTQTFTDDSGVTFSILINGGVVDGTTESAALSAGTLRGIAVGQGIAVGRIDLDLRGGANVTVRTLSAGSLALGEIQFSSAAGGTLPSFTFTGPGEIDVRLLRQVEAPTGGGGATGDTPVATIVNSTVGGDFVAIDVLGVGTVTTLGDLGRSQAFSLRPEALAPRMTLVVDEVNDLDVRNSPRLPVGVLGGAVGGTSDEALVPLNWDTAEADNLSLEDRGSPLDALLNGLVVRTGNVVLVSAAGSVGDVILQDTALNTGILGTVIANNDNRNTSGTFEGIVGSIYARSIFRVDLGDGLVGPGDTPLARAGIFADGIIENINAGTRVRNAVVTGVIAAGTRIGTVAITGGRVDRSFFLVGDLGGWWNAPRFNDGSDGAFAAGELATLSLTGTNLSRSRVFAGTIGAIRVTGADIDATTIASRASIGSITARNILDSTVPFDPVDGSGQPDGGTTKPYTMEISAGLNIGSITVSGVGGGTISDLNLRAGGSLTGSITAVNILRSRLDFVNNINVVTVSGGVTRTEITGASLTRMAVTGSVRASRVAIAGPITSLTAGQQLTDTVIASTGPNGRIGTISAVGDITGSLTSSGSITTLISSRGGINLDLTTTETTAVIGTLQAAKDIVLRASLGGAVTRLIAGGNIGRRDTDGSTPDTLVMPGDVTLIQAGGVIYSDIEVGGNLASIVSGRARGFLPGTQDFAADSVIRTGGRLTSLTWNGDFNGSVISSSGGIGTVTITNGSFRAGVGSGNRIEARSGDITSVNIVRGHLLGDVIALDGNIARISVTGDAVFGDLGVNRALTTGSTVGVPASERRGQLPAGTGAATVGRDGPTIFAARNIDSITVAGGIFEALIQAGGTVGSVTAGRGIDFDTRDTAATTPSVGFGTAIFGGEAVNAVTAGQRARGVFVGGGVTGLGADGAAGGAGADADSVRSGNVGTLTFRGGLADSVVVAGVNAGDASYATTGDNTSAAGISRITRVAVTNPTGFVSSGNTVLADTSTGTVSGIVGGANGNTVGTVSTVEASFPTVAAIPGGSTAITAGGVALTINGQPVLVSFSGPGTAGYDPVTRRIVLNNSTSASVLRILPPAGTPIGTTLTVNGLSIVGNDEASLGTLESRVNLVNGAAGLPVLALDGTIGSMAVRSLTDTVGGAAARVGQGVTTLTVGVAGTRSTIEIETRSIGALVAPGGLGTVDALNQTLVGALVQAGNIGNVTITGELRGLVSSDRDIGAFSASQGIVADSAVRAGAFITSVRAGVITASRISAGRDIGSVTVSGFGSGVNLVRGSITASTIAAGVDLGRDGRFLGTGLNADSFRAGKLGAVSVSGDLVRSDVVAGVYRAGDGVVGTPDDRSGAGISSITSVTVAGAIQGSLLVSERFRITAAGTVGPVRAGGQLTGGNQNLLVEGQRVNPGPLAVQGLVVGELAGVYTIRVTFNQSINAVADAQQRYSLPAGSLRLFSLVDGTFNFALVEGPAGYTVSYDPATRTAVITLSTQVTGRNLDAMGNVVDSGPGQFRIELDAGVLRGTSNSTLLDGDGNGISGDSYVRTIYVGDVGDRLNTGVAIIGDPLNPILQVNFYAPTTIPATALRPERSPFFAGLNNPRSFTYRSFLGDHPNANLNDFASGSDIDLYTIELQRGEFFQLSTTRGFVTLLNPAGDDTAANAGLVANFGGSLLVLESGTYFIMVTADDPEQTGQLAALTDSTTVVNLPPNPGAIGAYDLTVRLWTDGDTGFDRAGVVTDDLVDGSTIGLFQGPGLSNIPLPGEFAGADGVLGNGDDLASIVRNGYTFTRGNGTNGVANGNGTFAAPSDDIVTGVPVAPANGRPTIVRSAGTDGVFSNAGLTATGLANVNAPSDDSVFVGTNTDAPLPSDFAGADRTLGTADDLVVIRRGQYDFVLEAGTNGRIDGNGTVTTRSDDRVVGTNFLYGGFVTRTAGTDGVFGSSVAGTDRRFGTADDGPTDDAMLVSASIGVPGAIGATPSFSGDADVFFLNAGQTLAPGTRLRLTFSTSQTGGVAIADRAWSQFALFEVPDGTDFLEGRFVAGIDPAQLLNPRPNTVLSEDLNTRVSVNAQGDLVLELTVPPSLDDAAVAGRFAVYIQGLSATPYTVQTETVRVAPPVQQDTRQRFLIETNGGQLDWLDPLSRVTLAGFVGPTTANVANPQNLTPREYILEGVINRLNAFFVDAGLVDGLGAPLVTFTRFAAEVAGLPSSTIFVTDTDEPAQQYRQGRFGQTQVLDPLNSNRRGEGVVYATPLNVQPGVTLTQDGLDLYVETLAAAVARRALEMMGLRQTAGAGGGNVPLTASNAPAVPPAAPDVYEINADDRPLGQTPNSSFFMGTQNESALLRRIFGLA